MAKKVMHSTNTVKMVSKYSIFLKFYTLITIYSSLFIAFEVVFC